MRERSGPCGAAGARRAAVAAALAAGLTLTGACGRGGDRGRGASAASTTTSAAAARPAEPGSAGRAGMGAEASAAAEPAGASGPLGDENIFALLEQANRAQVENGRLAERRAPSADVKAYARDMVREHAALQDRADALARTLAVIPQLPLNDAGGLEAAATRTTLGSVSGADFDRAYIASEVDDHERTLQLLQRARTAAEHAELRALIDSAIPTVRSHLGRAKKLQDRVGAPTS